MSVKRYELYPEQQVKCCACSADGKYGLAIAIIINAPDQETEDRAKESISLCSEHDAMFGCLFETDDLT